MSRDTIIALIVYTAFVYVVVQLTLVIAGH